MVNSFSLPDLVGKLDVKDGWGYNNWISGWTGLAAEALKGGFLSTVGPTLWSQTHLVQWLANCYSLRATTIQATRNNILRLIAQATSELTEAAPPTTETPKDKPVVNAVSQAWDVASTVMGALDKEVPSEVGIALKLIDFALNIREEKPNDGLRFPQLSDFFTHLDTAVRALHTDLDAAEVDYAKATRTIDQEIARVDRSALELYDITHHGPGDHTPQKPSDPFSVDVAAVMEIAQHCYDIAEIYGGQSGLLSKIWATSYADGQLVGRGVVPTSADTALIALRNEVESFFQKTTARYLTVADRIKEAAQKYAERDAGQRDRLKDVITEWETAGEGEYGQRSRIDLDPGKDGIQN